MKRPAAFISGTLLLEATSFVTRFQSNCQRHAIQRAVLTEFGSGIGSGFHFDLLVGGFAHHVRDRPEDRLGRRTKRVFFGPHVSLEARTLGSGASRYAGGYPRNMALHSAADISAKYLFLLVPVERIELPTFGLQNRCSTAELNRLRY